MKKLFAILAVLLIVGSGAFLWPKSSHDRGNIAKTQTNKKYKYVDPQKYLPVMSTNPQWYLDPNIKNIIDSYIKADETTKSSQWIEEKHEFIQMIGDMIDEGKIKLGNPGSGQDMDSERKAVDTIVIHHTQTAPDRNRAWFNGLQLLTLYVPVYSDPKSKFYGQTITSGHFDSNGKPMFIAYHYMVYQDGSVIHNLQDNQIGWHAGKWEINRRSIAIVFVDDLSNKWPTDKALTSARNIIQTYKDKNPDIEIIGHKEVEPSHTKCPGDKFEEWKGALLSS